MGFRLTSLQIRGKDHETILRLLQVRAAGAASPVSYERMSGRVQPDGAYLVVAMDDQGRHAEPGLRQTLSAKAELLVCQIHEGCMWSQTGGWRDGAQIWSIEYTSEFAPRRFEVVGQPPATLAEIQASREARQAAEPPGFFGVDHIFDIAPALYAALTGYRYDRYDPAAVFEALVPISAQPPDGRTGPLMPREFTSGMIGPFCR